MGCGLWFGGVWAIAALVAATTFNVALAAPDPLGVLRALILWPVTATFIVGPLLSSANFYHITDILPLTLLVGVVGGFLGSIIVILGARSLIYSGR